MESKAQRSLTTGHLLITMPKVLDQAPRLLLLLSLYLYVTLACVQGLQSGA